MNERFNPELNDDKEFLDLVKSIENDDDLSPEFRERLIDFVCAGKEEKIPVHELKKTMEANREALLKKKHSQEERLQEEHLREKRLDTLVGPGDSARIRGQVGQTMAAEIERERREAKASKNKKPN